MKIALSKYHGLGNDFLLARYKDLKELDHNTLIDLIQKACSRHAGIGADGFILVKEDPLEMIYYNQDGSRADMCGNGLRCFARFVKEEGLVNSSSFLVKTLAGDKVVHLLDPDFKEIELELGEPDLSLEKLALSKTILEKGLERDQGIAWIDLKEKEREKDNNHTHIIEEEVELEKEETKEVSKLYLLYMNTIHAILFEDELEKTDQPGSDLHPDHSFSDQQFRRKLGEYYANSNELLVKGTNLNFVTILDDHTIEMQTYERGCGFTLACGTGAAASAYAAMRLKGLKSPLMVKLALGKLLISLRDGKVVLCGPAERIMKGDYFYE